MSRQAIRRLIDALRPYEPERIYLVGSYARGEEDTLSDIDVVIIKETTAPFFDRLREVGQMLPQALGAVGVLVYSPGEFSAMLSEGNAFAEMVAEEGRLVYGGQAEG